MPDDAFDRCVAAYQSHGNVVMDDEVRVLQQLAAERDIRSSSITRTGRRSLTLSSATPGPCTQVTGCVSESLEIGLPGVRTGLVVAPEPVIEALGAMNAVVSLASNSMGPALVLDLVQSGELVRVS